jgi:hypothetical protein
MVNGQEGRDVVAECSPDAQVPTPWFVRRRDMHVPRSDEVTQCSLNGLPDNGDDRGIRDVSNLDVNRIDDEHRAVVNASAAPPQSPVLARKGSDLDDKSLSNAQLAPPDAFAISIAHLIARHAPSRS